MLKNTHPGDVLKEEFLEPLGLSAYALASALRVQRTAIGQILAGKRSVTPLMALRLARFFGTTAQFWLNLQAAYDLEEQQRAHLYALEEIQPYERPDGQENEAIRELLSA